MCHMYVLCVLCLEIHFYVGNAWFYMFKPCSWFVCEISLWVQFLFSGLFVMKVVVGTQIQTWELSCEDVFVMLFPGLVFQKRPQECETNHGFCSKFLFGWIECLESIGKKLFHVLFFKMLKSKSPATLSMLPPDPCLPLPTLTLQEQETSST